MIHEHFCGSSKWIAYRIATYRKWFRQKLLLNNVGVKAQNTEKLLRRSTAT